MKAALFDTNILIDYSRGIEQASDTLNKYTYKHISITTWIEYLVGVPAPRMEAQKRLLEENFEILDFTQDAAEETILIRKNTRLKLPDAMIYATAKSENLPFITRNTNDFNPNWPDIQVPYQL